MIRTIPEETIVCQITISFYLNIMMSSELDMYYKSFHRSIS